jgi:hypothetical protein
VEGLYDEYEEDPDYGFRLVPIETDILPPRGGQYMALEIWPSRLPATSSTEPTHTGFNAVPFFINDESGEYPPVIQPTGSRFVGETVPQDDGSIVVDFDLRVEATAITLRAPAFPFAELETHAFYSVDGLLTEK